MAKEIVMSGSVRYEPRHEGSPIILSSNGDIVLSLPDVNNSGMEQSVEEITATPRSFDIKIIRAWFRNLSDKNDIAIELNGGRRVLLLRPGSFCNVRFPKSREVLAVSLGDYGGMAVASPLERMTIRDLT